MDKVGKVIISSHIIIIIPKTGTALVVVGLPRRTWWHIAIMGSIFFNHDCTLPALGLEYDLWLPPGERLENRLAKVIFHNEVEPIRKT